MGKYCERYAALVFKMILELAGIVVTVISIIVTTISIRQTKKK